MAAAGKVNHTDFGVPQHYSAEAKALSIASYAMNRVCPSREWRKVSCIMRIGTAACGVRKGTDGCILYSRNAFQTSSLCLPMCLKIVQEWLTRGILLFVLLTPTGTGFILSMTGSPVTVCMDCP